MGYYPAFEDREGGIPGKISDTADPAGRAFDPNTLDVGLDAPDRANLCIQDTALLSTLPFTEVATSEYHGERLRTLSTTERIVNDAPDQFERLRERWKKETRYSSSISEIVLHEAYQQIIGMGPAALPLILADLEKQPDFWFPALRAISGENPVREDERGDVEAMRESWLRWAGKHGRLSPA